MHVNRSLWKKSKLLFAISFLAFNLLLLFWYLFSGYQTSFHSDAAAKVLLAREIVETGNYFPADWNYVNKDLFVLFGHTFIIPMLAFMPAGYLTHAVSGLVSSVLILSGTWLVTGLIQVGLARRIFILAIVAAGISGFMAENLYGQVSYGAFFYLSCFIVFFSWRYIGADWGKKWPWGAALFIVIVLAFWANPQRALVSYGLPLVAAILMLRIKFTDLLPDNRRNGIGFLLGIVCAGIVIGAYLHMLTISGVNNVLGAGHARWLPYDLMLRNLTLTPKGYLAIFGGLPSAESIVVSKSGVYEAVRLIGALTLLVLMPITIIRALRQRESGLIFLCVYALVAFMVVILLQITTTIADMSDPIQSSRYLIPSLLFLMILVLLQPIDLLKAPIFGLSALLVSVVFLTSAYPSFVSSGPNSNYTWGMPGQRNSQHEALADFLVNNGLRYGYASYWNAGVLSVISDEKVLVRQVVFDNGIPMPMRHLSSNRWYRPSAWQGESFLLIANQEETLINWERLALYQGRPVRELTYGNFKIYVFGHNIANNMPGWDSRLESPVTFHIDKFSLSQTGRFVEDFGSDGPALIAEKGEAGALHFGPYISVEPGSYTATFDVHTDKNPGGTVRLDVAGLNQFIHVEKILTESSEPQTLSFTLEKPSTLEFRVWALGSERVVFRDVTVKRDRGKI